MLSLENYRYDVENCVRCSNCKWVDYICMKSKRFSKICPSHTKYLFDVYSCQGRMDVARGLMNKELDYTETVLDVVYKCTMCGACDIMCKRCLDLEPLEVLETLRIRLVEEGLGPMPAHKAYIERAEKTNNVFGEPHEKRFSWVPQEFLNRKDADVIFFVGCLSSYRSLEVAKATLKILDTAGVKVSVLTDEWCCGSPIFRVGDLKTAKKLMEHNLSLIKDTGVNKVVTSCAGCYKMFKVDYPKILGEETGLEVAHIVECIDKFLDEGKLKFSKEVNLKVTYHDPCHLGRLSEPYVFWKGERKRYGLTDPPKKWRRGTYGVYEPPRKVLRSIPGITLVEMERIKENAWCCGAGGGVMAQYRDFAEWTAKERIEEAKVTGAEAVVSCCPFCKLNLEPKAKEAGMQMFDLTELIIKALGLEV